MIEKHYIRHKALRLDETSYEPAAQDKPPINVISESDPLIQLSNRSRGNLRASGVHDCDTLTPTRWPTNHE